MYITMVLFIQYSVTCLCKFGLKKKINLFMRQSVLETAQCFCEWQQTELKGQILEGSGPGRAGPDGWGLLQQAGRLFAGRLVRFCSCLLKQPRLAALRESQTGAAASSAHGFTSVTMVTAASADR